MAQTAWRKDRITDREDDATGLKIVELPRVKGMTNAIRDEVFAFEREHLGTVRAVIRMNKRAQGTELPIPARLAKVEPPANIAHLYA